MYTSKEKQEELKTNILRKIEMREKRKEEIANEKKKKKESRLNNSRSLSI